MNLTNTVRAVNYALVALRGGVYSIEEACEAAAVLFNLDEFDAEDLPMLVRNRIARGQV